MASHVNEDAMRIKSLETIVASPAAARVLLYLDEHGQGHAVAIARMFRTSHSQVRKQLLKFERAGMLRSEAVGRARIYRWDPTFALQRPLRELLHAARAAGEAAAASSPYLREETRVSP